MSYATALKMIREYPGEGLADCAYVNRDGLCCAIGVLSPEVRALANSRTIGNGFGIREVAMYHSRVAMELLATGLTLSEAEDLQYANDCFHSLDSRARKAHIINWLERKVREEESR